MKKQEDLKEREAIRDNKKGKKSKVPLEEQIIYFTVGALFAKFLEIILKLGFYLPWWISLLFGGFVGLALANRRGRR